jgi:hypothetical protein
MRKRYTLADAPALEVKLGDLAKCLVALKSAAVTEINLDLE